MTLIGDPTVKFGGAVVGGIKIAALSDIDKPLTINLTVTKGKRAPHRVEPLTEPTTAERIASLRAGWKGADADQRKVIEAEVEALSIGDGAE